MEYKNFRTLQYSFDASETENKTSGPLTLRRWNKMATVIMGRKEIYDDEITTESDMQWSGVNCRELC